VLLTGRPASRTSSRARRLATIPALLACAALVLSACGDDSSGDGDPLGGGSAKDRLDAVSISGDVGTAPDVTWKGEMQAGKVETETLTEGDGDELKGQDDVLAQLWIGNGYSQREVYSTYADKKAELLTVNNQLPDFLSGIRDAKIGSRLAITASAEEMFGQAGNSQLDIGNKDSVLVIVDLVSKVLDKPEGEQTAYPSWMPKPTFEKGVIKGTGPRVKKGQTIAVRYLGQTFGGDKPFDQNFGDDGQGAPTTFSIGTGAVIKGWDQGLVGVPVGSRVVLEVPPDLGYGEQGSDGIPANSTLVFMIDVLGAA
jgi:peptidylprolyl isomerase